MAANDHDHNLLFGILAVQLDFISRDALVAAMHAWVLAKDKPLGEILVDQRALASDRRTLLDALVCEHLKQHGNDPEKSLAAVSSLGFVRDDLKQIADPDLQASIAHLPERSVDPYATHAQSVGSSTSLGTRFRILRPHAEGGLGKVSVARDEELQREVALKEIKERHADNLDSRARFMLEAEITGGLEHPGIVPVYGLGQYADGRPYYAMRFIRGDSLKEAVDHYHDPQAKKASVGERAVELRKLLGRFLDVCNAITYAHSRGVLHRDLKPGNIMLGQYGETLVVDWGLAKALDRPDLQQESSERPLRPASASGSAATQMGSALGTPQYMSPEQAAGRLDLLGPASDVYSLGATLYYVLTGKAPIEAGDVGAVLKRVERGDFPPPRAVKPEVAPPLNAICLKAMALKPEDRYGSLKTLADDVEHWMADEPVSAYNDPLTVRVARFAPGHKLVVAAIVGLMLSAIVALWISNIFLEQERKRTDDQRRSAEAERNRAQGAEEVARQAEVKALHQAMVANQISELVAVIFHESDPLFGGGPRDGAFHGQTLAQAEITVDYCVARVRQQLVDQPLIRSRLLCVLGNVYRSLGLYEKAKDLLKQSRTDILADPAADVAERATCRFYWGWWLHDHGQYTDALAEYREAVALRQSLPGDPIEKDLLVTAIQFNVAWTLCDMGKSGEAVPIFRNVLEVRRKHLPRGHHDLAIAQIGLLAAMLANGSEIDALRATVMPELSTDEIGQVYLLYESARLSRRSGNYTIAIAFYEQLLTLLRRRFGDGHLTVAMLRGDMAGLYRESGDWTKGEQIFRESLATVRATIGEHPKLVEPLFVFGAALAGEGEFAEAEAAYREALDISLRHHPENYGEHASAYRDLAATQLATGRFEEALQSCRTVEQLGREKLGPLFLDNLLSMAKVYENQGEHAQAAKHWQAAEKEARSVNGAQTLAHVFCVEAESLRENGEELAAKNATAQGKEQLLRAIESHERGCGAGSSAELLGSADLANRLGEYRRAADWFAKAIPLEIKDWKPPRPPDYPELVIHRCGLAECLSRVGDRVQAEELFARSERELKAKLGNSHPILGICLRIHARALAASDKLPEAERLLRDAVNLFEIRWGPNHPWVLGCSIELAEVLDRQGRFSEAGSIWDRTYIRVSEMYPLGHPYLVQALCGHCAALVRLGKGALSSRTLAEFEQRLNARLNALPARNVASDLCARQLQKCLYLANLRAGDASIETGNRADAEKFYVHALPLVRRLAEAEPDDPQCKLDLTICEQKIRDSRQKPPASPP